MSNSCKQCVFWDETSSFKQDGDGLSFAWCRRYPPVASEKEFEKGFWPIVCESDWCGEFRSSIALVHAPGEFIVPDESKTIPVSRLNLSKRAWRVINEFQIRCLGDFCGLTADKILLHTKNVGTTTLNELREKLRGFMVIEAE